MEIYGDKSLIHIASGLVCNCFQLPSYGDFTIGQMYCFEYTIDAVIIIDDSEKLITLSEKDFNVCFSIIGEAVTSVNHPMMNDKTVYCIYLVLDKDTCNLEEIKAYAKIFNLNYIQSKLILTNKRNLIAKGNACYIKEIIYKLNGFKVHYEIEPKYPYE